MFQEFVDRVDQSISKQRAASYLGSARVNFQDLDFSFYSAEADPKNIKRLRAVFKRAGCFPLKTENRIPALIDPTVLENAIQLSGIPVEQIRQPEDGNLPHLSLPPSYKLRCLQGRSRVRAAEVLLPNIQHSWAIDFYAEGGFYQMWCKGDS